jgi:hypothetical protein
MDALWDIKSKLDDLRNELMAVHRDRLFQKFMRALAAKFDPSQPRDEIGRWTSAGTAEAAASVTQIAARGTIAECEAQYQKDSAICRIVRTATCWKQAMARRAACVSGYPLPPLNFLRLRWLSPNVHFF